MASRPDPGDVAFPTDQLLQQLWKGKAALHARHANLSLLEKVRLVIELQRIVLPLIARQRPLHALEKVWEIDP
jgi:hypothetical protein